MKQPLRIIALGLISLLSACASTATTKPTLTGQYHNNQTGITEYLKGTTSAKKLYLQDGKNKPTTVDLDSDGSFTVDLTPSLTVRTVKLADNKDFTDGFPVKTDAVKPVTNYALFRAAFNRIVDQRVTDSAIALPATQQGLESYTADNITMLLNVDQNMLLGISLFTRDVDDDDYFYYLAATAIALEMDPDTIGGTFNTATKTPGKYFTAEGDGVKLTFIVNEDDSATIFTRVQ